MKISIKHLTLVLMSAATLSAAAQTGGNGKLAIKASTEIGLSNSFSTTSSLDGLSAKASGSHTGVEFGWTFFQKSAHSLEANIGVAYSPMTATLDLRATDYDYSAPASADEDGETYIRCYELGAMSQKVKSTNLTLPVYLTYYYRCNERVRVHADLGVRIGLTNASSSLDKVSGEAYSYGIYPQYDNLMINAPYMNGFGTTDLATAGRPESVKSNATSSFLAGIGAEVWIAGPLSVDLSLRYSAGLTNSFKQQCDGKALTAVSAPVTYTVSEGQRVKSLTDYLGSSKLSQLSLKIGLICRF